MRGARRSPIWSDPRVKPPFGVAEIDWRHPLAPLAGWLFNEGGGNPYDVTRRLSNSTSVAMTWAPTGLIFVRGTPAQYVNLGRPSLLQLQTLSYFAIVRNVTTSAIYRALFGGGSGGPPEFRIDNDRKLTLLRQDVVGIATSTATVPALTRSSVGCTYNASGLGVLYIDGKDAGGSATGVVTFVYNDNLFLGGALNSHVEDFDGVLETAYIFPRALTAGEMLWLATEPYAMLRPIVRRRYFVPAVGATPIIRDQHFSLLLLDLGMGVLPTPAAASFTYADLFQAVGKYRGFAADTAVEPAVVAAGAGESFIPVIRRRRR